ncbi:hypothetical protein TNCV_1400731 [Trichonephila clavipes]|nr:hypothetical protein TNCV_1400731 [Trichonephila clavipes]
MPSRPDNMRNGPPARLQNAPPDLYEYQDYEEEDEYEYKDCCCITGLLRDLDLIQLCSDLCADGRSGQGNGLMAGMS